MRKSRRRFLQDISTGIGIIAASDLAWAQSYPARPVRIVVGFTAGGAFDIVARLLAQWLGDQLHQPFIVENRPGASTNIATEAVIRAPADGYTLLLGGATNAINATLFDKLNFDFVRDIAPVAGVARFPNVMEVNPAFPVSTLPQFIEYAKANPGKINMGSSGNGTSQHLCGELFKLMTGAELVHVPYKGSAQSMTDLLSGTVQVSFDPLPACIEHIKAGRLRALAVTTATRSEALPSVPAVAEFVPGYEASAWNGICAPRGTPADIVARLNTTVNAGLADPSIKSRLAGLGATTLAGSPGDFATLIAEQAQKWGKVIREANIKPG
jgi:tripartite-type tricarboxylate transporter receptor subunit TctC